MKIYFAGSIRGGRDDKELYLQLIQYISQYGQVLTEHIGEKNLTEFGETILQDHGIYTRDMAWLREADVVIAEVSTPSLGVGYEISKAEDMNKKMLCLYRTEPNKRLSAMIGGNANIKIAHYATLEEAMILIDNFFNQSKGVE
jgi:hypothetical protein